MTNGRGNDIGRRSGACDREWSLQGNLSESTRRFCVQIQMVFLDERKSEVLLLF